MNFWTKIKQMAEQGTPLIIKGPLYPKRQKGRSKRGWTSVK